MNRHWWSFLLGLALGATLMVLLEPSTPAPRLVASDSSMLVLPSRDHGARGSPGLQPPQQQLQGDNLETQSRSDKRSGDEHPAFSNVEQARRTRGASDYSIVRDTSKSLAERAAALRSLALRERLLAQEMAGELLMSGQLEGQLLIAVFDILKQPDARMPAAALPLLVEMARDRGSLGSTRSSVLQLAHRIGGGAEARKEIGALLESDDERPIAIDALRGLPFEDTELTALRRTALTHGNAISPSERRALTAKLARAKGANWGAVQATGEPDTFEGGDHVTAWASKYADMGNVTLDMTFERAVYPSRIRIHETYNPGAVVRVEGKGVGGDWELLWEGHVDSNGAAIRWLDLALNDRGLLTRTIRLTLDTHRASGWNEIDAVQLIDALGGQWASSVTASSTYGTSK